jgi:pimeloyl-ACP methyl ester carboxylesterase
MSPHAECGKFHTMSTRRPAHRARIDPPLDLVVFIHGWGVGPAPYARAVSLLARESAVVLAPDSFATDALWNLPGTVAALTRTIDDAGLGPAVIVGHSLGGGIAIALAHARPELVSHLVLVDSVGIPTHGRSVRNWLAPFPRYVGSITIPTVFKVSLETAIHPGRILHLISAGAWALHVDLEQALTAVGERTRTSVVWGDRDGVTPPESGRRMADLLGVPLHMVHGDHDWPMRRPHELAAAVRSLTSRDTSASGEATSTMAESVLRSV